ncbi:MAG: amidohydrolase family protein [Lentisphaeria bacterium]|jgi:glutamate-1-semialdehyde 2,1-aminomutase|nr:amidohydrolase family protein [Lentisphaeria bacterium]MDP7741786.1 amidohydrolase family protein [Lentisphaeria bacterium]
MRKPEDQEFYEHELASFLPDRIFDAHCHLWQKQYVPWAMPDCPAEVDYDTYMTTMAEVHGDRTGGALFISYAAPDDDAGRHSGNEWMGQQTARDRNCRGLFFVTPNDDPEWVRQEVRRLGLHGLKCYHTFADATPTWETSIPNYLPEPLVAVANEEGWVITLHMVKTRAVADPDNIHWIRKYCEAYPDMRLILAHSARGFQPTHNLEGLPQLTGLDNLYFDTSANCEPMAHQAIIRIIGHERLMYGSDLPVSHQRGRSVAAADTFLWLYAETPVWEEIHRTIEPVLTGLEHLRSIKWACWSEHLDDNAVEDIFWNNAARLFEL